MSLEGTVGSARDFNPLWEVNPWHVTSRAHAEATEYVSSPSLRPLALMSSPGWSCD